MKLEYILIGSVALISLFILVFYSINTRRINKKQIKVPEKKKVEEKAKDEEIEVPAEQTAEKPVEKAIKEANIGNTAKNGYG